MSPLAVELSSLSLPSSSTLPGLFSIVALGSLLPVLPTGAAVSAAAVLAVREGVPATIAVLVVAAVAAMVGDLALYKLASWGGEQLLERLRLPVSEERLARAQSQIEDHGKAVLTLSRLIPGGRIPVMVACIGLHVSLPVFAAADVVAASAWAALYGGIGIAGGAIFPHVWQGVVAGVVVVVLIAVAPGLWSRWRADRPAASPTDQRGATPE
ncbi:VTT domain-containing protein [Rhodococcus antarcticus]|jgi:membrane protein DedA with SNARE-associated domain|uniref:VTT domain-containing protein n=1 Tax=Rhodococcus antarcticus TaxID=2987751 RepID=A0ABY6P3V6_9NOCA|nr:VTT domain-containing protein [Rhodococcus antarcticus]UZJ26340.1 VTT domain-containing protein [Rhodococcus antarcticus]